MADETRLYNNVAALANVSRLLALIDRAKHRASGLPGMGCFYGRAGYGKTTAGVYATNKMDACHIEALPVGGTKKLLEMIVVELGLRPRRLVPDLFDQAAQELAVSDRPLIIDEADYILTSKSIEVIRKLHDHSGVPVILMGEELLPQRLQVWERVHGRMLAWVMAEPATIADVRQLASIYAPRVEVTPDLQERVLAASHQSMRYISTNLAAIAEFARAQGLERVSAAAWGGAPLHTGEPPAIRRMSQAPVVAAARRGRTAA